MRLAARLKPTTEGSTEIFLLGESGGLIFLLSDGSVPLCVAEGGSQTVTTELTSGADVDRLRPSCGSSGIALAIP